MRQGSSSRCYSAVIVVRGRHRRHYKRLLGAAMERRRSSVSVKAGPSAISIEVSASDPTALRASLTTVLRELQVIDAMERLAAARGNTKA